ncbi:hypothetical protein RRU01S_04_01560 [Agrobacterium rubi TR3 = NBRC 13261]|uniref:YubB ferredoxin-like domain-containing protein n=1 Tax=Agrobacterium rubi TR3 = NBRC 13261 TaxID=1368415 RepID=A0A081CRN8_9HYPH|nr:hypothetical protein [Agrobacterium rubi]MBP1876857.1 hypothetical protein [Agrobacterium rubi]MCL6651050.1 hypothetical protein [Agrobacterium rubi]GAK69334.1 hypothetical protein RRU01S_04_01560 [Agrobacterium rubi TR3 = NBRC 13261]
MPNHITNILTIQGEENKVVACLAAIKSIAEDEGGTREIDFNKIIPMPPELNITSDGLVGHFENQFMVTLPVKLLKDALMSAKEDTVENFCNGVKNLNKHGFSTWYGWSCHHWGTKWNAYETKVTGEHQITFDTAWNTPRPIFAALSTKWPDLSFHVEYADEDIGSNCGSIVYRKGVCEELDIADSDTFAKRVEGWEDDDDDEDVKEAA